MLPTKQPPSTKGKHWRTKLRSPDKPFGISDKLSSGLPEEYLASALNAATTSSRNDWKQSRGRGTALSVRN